MIIKPLWAEQELLLHIKSWVLITDRKHFLLLKNWYVYSYWYTQFFLIFTSMSLDQYKFQMSSLGWIFNQMIMTCV